MTPKEKAKELVDKLYQTTPNETCFSPQFKTGTTPYKSWEQAKQCALIAVDEIIETGPKYPSDIDWDDAGGTYQCYYEAQTEEALRYWQEVKQEIEKL